MIIHIPDVWRDAAHAHRLFLRPLLQTTVLTLRNGPEAIKLRVADFLDRNVKALCSARSVALPPVVQDFEATFVSDDDRTAAKNLIKQHLDYDAFSRKRGWHKRSWSAYKLCSLARYAICPYCHIVPIETKLPADDRDDGLRPNLDHYYAKAQYPYLALTLANLIPCCEKCNGPQCKHTTDFVAVPHLHPLSDRESVQFALAQRTAPPATLLGTRVCNADSSQFEIRLEPLAGAHIAKAQASLKTFALPERYEVAVDQMFRLRRQLMTLASRQQMLAALLPDLQTEKSDTVGFDVTNASYKNVPMGKLRLDIYASTEAELIP
ncbi:hypothetical protein CTP10_R47060 [Cupriavidus sp. P-10]|uniref:hypothetical protein n=1 Tax=Cupriavidus sp. P-10 TaxID=2027911 RepID=UPI000E2F5694|nr:hypothetical protein [Cupriavidus sp. P-10]BDB27301.1 hypothetical protein CTP10_R47060 [Cupriavidus sp. P-10]